MAHPGTTIPTLTPYPYPYPNPLPLPLPLPLTWQCKQAKAKYRQTFEELREVRSKQYVASSKWQVASSK